MQIGEQLRFTPTYANNEGIIGDGDDDKDRIVSVTIPDTGEAVTFVVEDFLANRMNTLASQLPQEEFAGLLRRSRLQTRQLGDHTFYKTRDNLPAYFHVVHSAQSDARYLLCLGHGEWQPMRYVTTVESFHLVE